VKHSALTALQEKEVKQTVATTVTPTLLDHIAPAGRRSDTLTATTPW